MKILKFLLPVLAVLGMLSFALPAYASTPTPAVWIGSPFAGNWPDSVGCYPHTNEPADCSLPFIHHIEYGSDFAMDLQGTHKGAPVVVFAAPKINGLPIDAFVEYVGNACKSNDPADGGKRVTVGFYNGNTSIGQVTYAHVDTWLPYGIQKLKINRWNSQIGTVGEYRYPGYYGNPPHYVDNPCWTGIHLHLELTSTHRWACYSGYWKPGQAIGIHDFIGFIGGAYATGIQQACPNGA